MDTHSQNLFQVKIFKLATNPSVERFIALLNVLSVIPICAFVSITAAKLFLVLYKMKFKMNEESKVAAVWGMKC